MTGIVLCGGNSTRMGTDKGLLKENNLTWTELAAFKLAQLHLPVFISVNQQQLEAYNAFFRKEQLVADNDLHLKGPLLGLLSAHLQFPEEDLFVLACDIKDMTVTLLQNLYTLYEQGAHEAYVYSTKEKHQPLCGIYTSVALQKIYRLLQEQQLKRHSMMHILDCLHTAYIAVEESDLSAFNNYNNPEDLRTES